ncbi:MAG: metallophosphoesterase family protein [Myxococcota bacterium]
MRVALLSDAHLAGPDDPNQRRLVSFLATLEADRVCLLGDVFQHWWHWGDRPFARYAEVIAALRRFELSFVAGNHDFHAVAFFRAMGADAGDTLDYEWDGLRVHLEHGDAVDGSLGYRALTALLRGRGFAAVLDRLPEERAWTLLGRLAGHGDVRTDPKLVAAQHARAASLDADLVVMGHTHAPELSGRFCNLGASPATWLLIDGGVPSLQRHSLE